MKTTFKQLMALTIAGYIFSIPALAKVNVAHVKGDFTVAGPFTFNEENVKTNYEGLEASNYGYFTTTGLDGLPGQQSTIRELQYFLKKNPNISLPRKQLNNKKNNFGIGIRPIPVVDKDKGSEFIDGVDGVDSYEVKGSEDMDAFLRTKVFGYKGEEAKTGPIFSLLGYMHPEMSKLDFKELGNPKNLKTENGMTHLGAYVGAGETKNAPYGYHQQTWSLKNDDGKKTQQGFKSLRYGIGQSL